MDCKELIEIDDEKEINQYKPYLKHGKIGIFLTMQVNYIY